MARKYIGSMLSGWVMVLCVVLLFTPETHSQGFKARIQKFTISGSVGQPGVTMQGLPGVMTDENGVYSAEVDYSWSGTVTPVKLGYTFEPKQRMYSNVTENKTSDNYEAKLLTFTIAGSVGQPGVKMAGLPGDLISDQAGRYTATVDYGWTGAVTPQKDGYTFEPGTRMYPSVTEDSKSDDYKAKEVTFTISGSVGGVEGVTLKGLPGEPKTGAGGTYRVEVPYNWSGKVTPTKPGHTFMPEYIDYPQVLEPQTNQNYTASIYTYEISGSANMAGVTLEGLPGDPMTDTDGIYSATVEYGWSGKVTPKKLGYDFSPPSLNYTNVTENKENQNYNPSIIKLTISGSAGTSGVVMTGLDNVVSDATGSYTATVEYGWAGTITPEKDGYTFEPPNMVYSGLTESQSKVDFKPQAITYTISGNVGLPGVVLQGLPVQVQSQADSSFSAEVPYKWSGTVTPRKAGYTFVPPSIKYEELQASQPGQIYQAQIIQYTISGRIITETGSVQNVLILAENTSQSATTDANGVYQLLVDHGWRGKIIPQKDGYTFNPPSRQLESVAQDVPNQSFSGKVKMMMITDSIVLGDEPIQGVKITAEPGGATAITDTKGKYSLQVPYDWTGELIPEKPGFIFEPPSRPYKNVTENIDTTVAQRPAPPPTDVTTRQVPSPAGTQGTRPLGQGPVETTKVPPERAEALTEKERLEQRLRELEETLRKLQTPGLEVPGPNQLTTVRPGPPAQGPVLGGPMTQNLLDVLTRISEETGEKIAVDATVKPIPVSVGNLAGMTVPMALQKILQDNNTGYTFKKVGDAYLVFLPITSTFPGDDLRNVLQDISIIAGVTIVPDETVTGQVNVELNEVPLDTALEIVLAGTPYVAKKTPNYYLVADRNVEGSAFPQISETRSVRLNYIAPATAVGLLSPAFSKYVKAESATDPNTFGIFGGGSAPEEGRGHIVTVTAPPKLAARIVEDLLRLDTRPRHVLLDARIVAMDRGDLLNLGVEWGFPTIRAGGFTDSYLDGDEADGLVGTKWPWGLQMGFSFDRTFTDALNMAINMLQENQQADIISSPQVVGQDGKRSQIRVITEEWFMMQAAGNENFFYTQSQLEKIESGTTLTITPYIGDNNDITLEMAVEVSDSIPRGRGSELPVVTRRTAANSVTVRDGGTVALAGLTENRSRMKDKRVPGLSNLPLLGGLFRHSDSDKGTREIAVFVTAHLVPEHGRVAYPSSVPQEQGSVVQPTGNDFRQQLRDSLSRQDR